MSTAIQKLRIYAMLMRIQEIQESKFRRIQIIGCDRSVGKVLALGMDFGPVMIVKKPIEEKYPFKPFDIPDYEVFLNNDTQSKYFSKPKNNFKK